MTLFAALSTLYFYPPNGTPFMDQHAFFFSVLMMVAAMAGTVASTRAGEFVAWALVPVLFTLAYLSKQVPTAFAVVCVAVWVVLHPARMGRWILAAACGSSRDPSGSSCSSTGPVAITAWSAWSSARCTSAPACR